MIQLGSALIELSAAAAVSTARVPSLSLVECQCYVVVVIIIIIIICLLLLIIIIIIIIIISSSSSSNSSSNSLLIVPLSRPSGPSGGGPQACQINAQPDERTRSALYLVRFETLIELKFLNSSLPSLSRAKQSRRCPRWGRLANPVEMARTPNAFRTSDATSETVRTVRHH